MATGNIFFKNIVGCILTAAFVSAISCTRESSDGDMPVSGKTIEITALSPDSYSPAENGGLDSSKTYLVGTQAVNWKLGDKISAYYSSGTETVENMNEDGQAGKFVFPYNDYTYAFYPGKTKEEISSDVKLSGNTLTILNGIPQFQYAVAGSFDPRANLTVAAASPSSSSWKFYNAGALLAIRLVHVQDEDLLLKQIKISNEGTNYPMTGKAAVTINGDDTSTELVGTLGSDMFNNVILLPSSGKVEITVPSKKSVPISDAPTYYLVVAPGIFGGADGGLQIELTRYDDKKCVYKTDKVLSVGRNGNILLAELEVNDSKFGKAPTSITLNHSERVVNIGSSVQLSVASVTPDGASTEVTWSPSNPNLATVNETGLVTGKSAGEVIITATSAVNSSVKATCTIYVGDYAARIGTTPYKYLTRDASNNTAAHEVNDGGIITLLKDNSETYWYNDYEWYRQYYFKTNTIVDLNGYTISKNVDVRPNSSSGHIKFMNGKIAGDLMGSAATGGGYIDLENLWLTGSFSTGDKKCTVSGENSRVSSFSIGTNGSVTIKGGYYTKDWTGTTGITIDGGTLQNLGSASPYHDQGYDWKFVPYLAGWNATKYTEMTARTKNVYAKDGNTASYFYVQESGKMVHYESSRFYCEFSTTVNNKIIFTVPNVTAPAGSVVNFSLNGLYGSGTYVAGLSSSITCDNSSNSISFTMPSSATNKSIAFTLNSALNNQSLVIQLNHNHGSKDVSGSYRYCFFSSASIELVSGN